MNFSTSVLAVSRAETAVEDASSALHHAQHHAELASDALRSARKELLKQRGRSIYKDKKMSVHITRGELEVAGGTKDELSPPAPPPPKSTQGYSGTAPFLPSITACCGIWLRL